MILIVGAPGSGKSHQAKLIEEESNVRWLSMGELLRTHSSEDQKDRMEKGDLLDDGEVEDILSDAINQVSNGTRILIDGFPRRDSQVHWFRGFAKAARRDVEAIVHIVVSEDEVVKRLKKRGRQDDDETIVRKRYKMYQEEILPMVKHMKQRGTRVIEIDGEQKPEHIHTEIIKALKGTI